MILSVIIPSYQHRDYVLSCLAAAVAIPVAEKEIMVIDDGSRDGSPELIKQWLAAQPDGHGVTFVQHENRGLVRVLNEGLRLARGRYVYMVASDDIPLGAGIAALLARMEGEPAAGFAMGNARAFLDGGGEEWPTCGAAHRRFFELPAAQRANAVFLNYPVPLLVQSTLFRRDALSGIGGWDEGLAWDDYPTFVKLLKALPRLGTDFLYVPELCLVRYRQHANNTYRQLEKQVGMIVQAMDMLCPEPIRNKAVARIYVKFTFSALKTRQFPVAGRLLGAATRRSGVLGTAAEIVVVLNGLLRSRCAALFSRYGK